MDIGQASALATYEDGTDEWLEQRRKGVGGSDAATILGLKPYGNDRITLWRRKTGREEPFRGNNATEYGSVMEDYIFQRAAIECASNIRECDAQLQHPKYNWMLANVDGVIFEGDNASGIAEIKTSSSAAPTKGCHKYHYPQIQHYLAVTGLDYALYIYFEIPFDRSSALDIAEMFLSEDKKKDYWSWIADEGWMTTRTIDRDDDYIEHLIEAEKKFWSHVENETPPGEFIPEGVIEISDDKLADLLDQYGHAHAEIKAASAPKDAEERKESAKEAIKQRTQAIASAHGDIKEVRIKGTDDYVKWHGGGYWMAKPSTRDIKPEETGDTSGEESESLDDVEVPF